VLSLTREIGQEVRGPDGRALGPVADLTVRLGREDGPHLVDRLLVVRVAVVARGADAFEVADQLLGAAHAALLADPNLGGLCIAVREIDAEWEAEDADAGAVLLPARYEIRYRTHAIDLTQTG
jgi:hypothetical protein